MDDTAKHKIDQVYVCKLCCQLPVVTRFNDSEAPIEYVIKLVAYEPQICHIWNVTMLRQVDPFLKGTETTMFPDVKRGDHILLHLSVSIMVRFRFLRRLSVWLRFQIAEEIFI